jgi:hypothetical protein
MSGHPGFALGRLGGFGLVHPGFGAAHIGGGYALGHLDGGFRGRRFGGWPYHGGYGYGGRSYYGGQPYYGENTYGGGPYDGDYADADDPYYGSDYTDGSARGRRVRRAGTQR